MPLTNKSMPFKSAVIQRRISSGSRSFNKKRSVSWRSTRRANSEGMCQPSQSEQCASLLVSFCESSMTNPYAMLIVIANACLVLAALSILALAVWAVRGQIPETIRTKYSSSVRLQSHLPFAEAWRGLVQSDHLGAFVRSRRRRLIFVSALAALVQLLTAYAFLHTASARWQCEYSRIGLDISKPNRPTPPDRR